MNNMRQQKIAVVSDETDTRTLVKIVGFTTELPQTWWSKKPQVLTPGAPLSRQRIL